jgi:arabinose-5-phosphate isomerase
MGIFAMGVLFDRLILSLRVIFHWFKIHAMLKELLCESHKSLSHFFNHVDLNQAEKVFRACLESKGMIFFTGVGKSGLVAQKVAVTMTSTGTKALYLCPTNSIHGDLGMASPEDVFIFFSKSGESEELLTLIPYIRNKGGTLIAVVCVPESRLEKACDMSIILPLEKELCPFNMAPTISTTIQLMFGDILSIALMRHKKFTLDEYFLNHPGGKIGKSMVKVRDLMITGSYVPLCQSHHKLMDVLVELSNKRCGCILIVNPLFQLEGIFTDGDLRRALQRHGSKVMDVSMGKLMTISAKYISPDAFAIEAMKLMEADQKHPIMVLPVLEVDRKVVGLIKMHDILQSGI